MPEAALDGTFASPAMRRRERRWQAVGAAILAALVFAALAGVVGERGTVVRAALVYLFLLGVVRVAGRRTLAQVTNFDLILVLIIGDATQQAIIGDDYTLVAGVLAVSTLLLMDLALSHAKRRWPAARESWGVTRLDEIEHAVLEASGGISIVPVRPGVHSSGLRATVITNGEVRPNEK